MKIGDRIKELRESKGLIQKELAKKLGVAVQSVSSWEIGSRNPNSNQRKKLCAIFGITEAQLFGALTTQSIPVNKIPIISWVHANKFEPISDPFPVGISDDYIYSTIKGENIFALKVHNDCMSPEFNQGDIIIVDPNLSVEQGDYAIIADRDSDGATFKQFKKYGKLVMLHPLNPKYEDLELDHKKRYAVIGKVVEKIKKY
jgi:SOS-response transcriptional repressor LexA